VKGEKVTDVRDKVKNGRGQDMEKGKRRTRWKNDSERRYQRGNKTSEQVRGEKSVNVHL